MSDKSFFFIACLMILPWAGFAANKLTVSGSPATMRVNAAVAGSQPTNRVNSTTTYRVQTDNNIHSITGSISTSMAAGVTLSCQLQAPTTGTSAGSVALTTTAQNLVTGISGITSPQTKTITYTLSANVSAGAVASTSVTVTLTLN